MPLCTKRFQTKVRECGRVDLCSLQQKAEEMTTARPGQREAPRRGERKNLIFSLLTVQELAQSLQKVVGSCATGSFIWFSLLRIDRYVSYPFFGGWRLQSWRARWQMAWKLHNHRLHHYWQGIQIQDCLWSQLHTCFNQTTTWASFPWTGRLPTGAWAALIERQVALHRRARSDLVRAAELSSTVFLVHLFW